MACVDFNNSRKNNKWREVTLDVEKEKSIMKFFGVDTETKVDELLQHNLTLFDWIRKNQGFPYFVGRRINGENALTKAELNYIRNNGSKAIPIFKPYLEMCGKDNARVAVAILEELEMEKGISVYAELDANNATEEFLKDFVSAILDNGYTPGFYVDTDSYYKFDRQYSRAYQANEKLMKQCKIWATSPEMEEYYETRNGHNEKPEFWGPFAPSCITKEQISFWQYGKKAHPVNAYNGNRTDFNLNLTIEPYNIFDVKDVLAKTLNFKKNEGYKFSACIKSDNAFETVSVECNFRKAKSQSLLYNNKLYACDIISNHKILEFVICENNDVLSSKHIVTDGNVLVKLAFVSNEKSCVYYLRTIVSLAEYDVVKTLIDEAVSVEEQGEIQKICNQEMWRAKFFKENVSNTRKKDSKIEESTNIKNYIYKLTGDIYEAEIIPPNLMRTSISGDTYNIFATIPQEAVKYVGSECCTIKDVDGYPTATYYKDTMYDSGCYISLIAIWNLYPGMSDANNADKLIEFEFKKAYNALVCYYPNTNSIEVVYCNDDETYVVTSGTQIAINLVGCQTAYIDKCSFEVCLGGADTGSVSFLDDALTVLDSSKFTSRILGKLVGYVSNVNAVFSFLSDVADAITNYNYNKATHEYALYPECGLVVKQVGSTYSHVLGYKNAFLKLRATLDNVNIYSNSAVYYQVQTNVLSNFAGVNETIYIGGSKKLK